MIEVHNIKDFKILPKMNLIMYLKYIPTFYKNVTNMYLKYTQNVLSSLSKDMP